MDALRAQGREGREAVEAGLVSHHPDHAALEKLRSLATPAARLRRHQRRRPAKPCGKPKR